jgi:hypothetical protein
VRAAATLLGGIALWLSAGCGGSGVAVGPTPPTQPSQPTQPTQPQLTVTTTSLPMGLEASPYSVQFGAANGTGALTWSTTTFLPTGMSLSSGGVLSGTPTGTSCAGPITVTVTDSSTPAQSASGTFPFSVEGLDVDVRLGQIGTYYQNFVALECGTEPVTWSLVSGVLPPGVQMTPFPGVDAQLNVQGMPTQAGTFNFTVQATDQTNQMQASMAVTILPPSLKFSDGLMQLGVVNQPFDHTVSVSGGTPPYAFAVTSGSLPAGLSLNASTGEISGTPQTAGFSQFTITTTDSTPMGPNSLPSTPFTVARPNSILITAAALAARNDTIATATPIEPGTYAASLSPYTDSSGNAAPDQDYYVLTGNAGDTFQVAASNEYSVWSSPLNFLSYATSSVDPALEIVDSNGNRLSTCSDPVADRPPEGAPVVASAGNFTDACVTHSSDGNTYLTLQLSSANQAFYVHVFDFQGRARPDFGYTLEVTKK